MIALLLLLAPLLATAAADGDDVVDFLYEGEARTFYFNASNTATSVTLLGIILLMALVAYLIYYELALSPLSNEGFNRPQFNGNGRR
jgi:hypothetical protein